MCSCHSDVEDFARYFYQGLQEKLPEVALLPDLQMTSELQELVTDNIIYANVHCPTAVDVSRRHLDAVWDMTNGLVTLILRPQSRIDLNDLGPGPRNSLDLGL